MPLRRCSCHWSYVEIDPALERLWLRAQPDPTCAYRHGDDDSTGNLVTV